MVRAVEEGRGWCLCERFENLEIVRNRVSYRSRNHRYIRNLCAEAKLGRFLIMSSAGLAFLAIPGLVLSTTILVCESECGVEGSALFISFATAPGALSDTISPTVSKSTVEVTREASLVE